MNYIVYKTTNKINGKIYVGVHRTNPNIFDGYIGCGVSKKDQKKKVDIGFPKAVKKYGYDNFVRETLFIYPDTEEGMKQAYEKEAEIVTIDFVKSKDTYNLTVGGKFTIYENIKKTISQYTLDGKFIRTWNSISEAEETLNLTSIKNCLIGNSKYCGDWQWRYYEENLLQIDPVVKKEKSVFQFDLQGNLIKCWKSITEATTIFKNQESAKSAIHNVCTKITRQAFGYYWSFKDKFEYIPYERGTAIAKYNDSGEFLESYTSITEAAKENGIKSSANIIAAIKGSQKRCGGFRWRYFYGNTSNIKPLN